MRCAALRCVALAPPVRAPRRPRSPRKIKNGPRTAFLGDRWGVEDWLPRIVCADFSNGGRDGYGMVVGLLVLADLLLLIVE